VPLLVRRELWSHRLAAWQAWLYVAGMLIMTTAQSWAGALGVPRRTADTSYGGDGLSGWDTPMNIAGIGVGLAALSGALFVVLMVLTLLVGKRTDDPARLSPSAMKA